MLGEPTSRIGRAALGLAEIRRAWAGSPAGAPRRDPGAGAEAAVYRARGDDQSASVHQRQ